MPSAHGCTGATAGLPSSVLSSRATIGRWGRTTGADNAPFPFQRRCAAILRVGLRTVEPATPCQRRPQIHDARLGVVVTVGGSSSRRIAVAARRALKGIRCSSPNGPVIPSSPALLLPHLSVNPAGHSLLVPRRVGNGPSCYSVI